MGNFVVEEDLGRNQSTFKPLWQLLELYSGNCFFLESSQEQQPLSNCHRVKLRTHRLRSLQTLSKR
ncbi:MAG: hypothetical protein A2V62_08600 [Nitrospirae bacterium RBG_19FT_COMBO_58_9]|nr:MAG: hypothetical protein A2V62_08600 [Nitrospirae bacterium RBG_19FT_COMBO_58_9]